MIALPLAQALRDAGLVWRAGLHDFFAIPDRGMDDRVFVVTDMMASLELLRGWPVVTFHGTVEWALDYILTAEVVWLPTESQIREEVSQASLRLDPNSGLSLHREDGQYHCRVTVGSRTIDTIAPTGSEAYGLALLRLLGNGDVTNHV